MQCQTCLNNAEHEGKRGGGAATQLDPPTIAAEVSILYELLFRYFRIALPAVPEPLLYEFSKFVIHKDKIRLK